MIPFCFHPTRVVVVNNHPELIRKVGDNPPTAHMTFHPFNSSPQALHHINEGYQPYSFYDRCIVKKEKSPSGHHRQNSHIVDTHHKIYHPERFEEISTIVMGYSSSSAPFRSGNPVDLTAFEFFRQVKNPYIQKILLVRKKDKKVADKALSKGIIHHYICVQDNHCEEEFHLALQEAQWGYFNKISQVFADSIRPAADTRYPLADANFQKFFKAILSHHGFTEAYMCESTGSYLFLDEQAQDHGLVVNISEQLDFWVRSGQAKGVNLPLLKALKNREKMMCYHAPGGSLAPDTSHWEIYAHPTKTFQGQKNVFYYAFAPNMHDIDVGRILPFQEYRQSRKSRDLSVSYLFH